MAFGNFVESDAASGIWRTIPFDDAAAVKLYFSKPLSQEAKQPVSLVWRGVASTNVIQSFFESFPHYTITGHDWNGVNVSVSGKFFEADEFEFWATTARDGSLLTPEVGIRLDAKYVYNAEFIAAAADFFQKTFENPGMALDEFETLLSQIKSAIEKSYPNFKSASVNLAER